MLLVHPATILVCGLAIGQLCVVNDCRVMTAWPCPALTPTAVFLPPFALEVIAKDVTFDPDLDPDPDLVVTVQRFLPSVTEAQQVDVWMEGPVSLRGQQAQCVDVDVDVAEGRYLSEGSRHNAACWGPRCTFIITKILPLPSPTPPPSPHSLTDHLASLELSAVSDSRDNSVCSSPATPAKEATHTAPSPGVTSPERGEWGGGQLHTPRVTPTQRSGEGFFKVTARTRFCVRTASGEDELEREGRKKRVTFESVGGMDKQIQQLRLFCVTPMLTPSPPTSLALARKGILVFGPPGTGKSLLAEALANELDVYTLRLSPIDVFSKYFGETEKKLRSAFQTARQRSPSLIIVDHVEGFCGRRYIMESRPLHTFITLMDALSEGPERCVVIGLTSKPDDLDPALRNEGRFEMEIETGVPTAADRLQILRRLLCGVAHALTEADMETLARTTHAYVGSDLKEVVLQGREQRWDLTGDIEAALTSSDLNWGVKQVLPSAMREVHLEVPQVRWSDIGGQEEIKLQLRQMVEWPITRPEAFKRLGITPPAGCLLYGPPGCSKTMIAKALATESGLNIVAVKGPELFDKYAGESERARAVREVFRKARSAVPSLIFFDDIDSLSVERGGSGGGNSVVLMMMIIVVIVGIVRSGGGNSVADRVLTQLLTEMDGIVALRGVTIVAATNRPDLIDKVTNCRSP
ncbi:hypothetical protein ACOMHN_059575 [Nucella lapillus]